MTCPEPDSVAQAVHPIIANFELNSSPKRDKLLKVQGLSSFLSKVVADLSPYQSQVSLGV
jgi:hypothetical protein